MGDGMLTSKQRAYLRGLGQDLDPVLQIGKGGITEQVVKQADDALEARELIKVRLLRNATITLQEATEALCAATQAHPVSQVGRVALLYRRSKKAPRIELPS